MRLTSEMPFYPSHFPGYEHTNTTDSPSALGRYDDFVSLIFQPGDQFGHW